MVFEFEFEIGRRIPRAAGIYPWFTQKYFGKLARLYFAD